MNRREVSQDEFYSVIGPMDVNGTIVGPWPYVTEMKTPSGRVVGWRQSGRGPGDTKFFLPVSTTA